MTVLGGHGRAHHIGGGADGRGAAAQVRAHGQRPGQHMQVHALGLGHGLDHRHHGGGKGDVVHKGGDQHRSPDDDGIGQEQISAAHSRNDMAEIIDDPRPFNAPDHQEQSCQQC